MTHQAGVSREYVHNNSNPSRYCRTMRAIVAMMVALSLPSAALAQLSLQVTTVKGKQIGVAFVVSNQGYLATSFTLLEDAKSAKAVTENGQTFDVAGFVAASREHDVVLLALRDPPDLIALPQLAAQQQHTPGENLFPSVGPSSQSLVPQLAIPEMNNLPRLPEGVRLATMPTNLYTPRLAAVTKGSDLMAGWELLDPKVPGQGLDTDWLIMDVGLDATAVGAPIWDSNARMTVVGMISGLLTSKRARFVVHIRHVQDLIPQGKATIRALSSLAKYETPIAKIPTAPQVPLVASLAERGKPLADRFADYQKRAANMEKTGADSEQQLQVKKANEIQTATAADAALLQFRAMRPEKTVESKDGEKDRPNTWSQRQLAAMGSMYPDLVQKIHNLAAARAAVQFDTEFTRTWMKRRVETTVGELIYLVDPLEIRHEDDHRALLASLDTEIAQGGAAGGIYLARGLCQMRLRKLPEAERDFREAVQIDSKLAHVAAVAESRRLTLLGDRTKATQLSAKAIRLAKDDARIEVLLARIELDHKSYSAATRLLKESLDHGGDATEIHQALAWIYATAPGTSGNGRTALSHAQLACTFTSVNDWSSLAALAAAYARSGDWDEAQQAISESLKVAPAPYQKQCGEWQATIAQKQPLQCDW